MDKHEEGFLTVRVPVELLDGVTEEARRLGLKRSALVRHVLTEWMKARPFKTIPTRREGN